MEVSPEKRNTLYIYEIIVDNSNVKIKIELVLDYFFILYLNYRLDTNLTKHSNINEKQ